MRIAFFTDTFYPQINGVTKTLGQLANFLKQNNIPHLFLAPDYPNRTQPMDDLPILRFKSILFPPYPECRLSLPHYAKLKRQLDAFQPDIIHVVTPLGIGQAGVRYAKENKVPLVSSFHTNFDAYLKYYNLTSLEPILWNFFKSFHANFDINFCPSYDTKSLLEKQGISNVKIWSRGIHTGLFSPRYRKNLNHKDTLKILYAGRLAAEKDLDVLIESIHILNKKYKDKIDVYIAGDGPFKNQMLKRAPNNMIFMGYLKGQNLSEIYASCDIFAFPSSTETFGNVILEAMASGLPVVAVKSGGVIENVHDHYNGLLATPCNPDSFAKALEFLITNRELRLRLSHNALHYVKKKSWNQIFNDLIADYRSLEKKMNKKTQNIA